MAVHGRIVVQVGVHLRHPMALYIILRLLLHHLCCEFAVIEIIYIRRVIAICYVERCTFGYI